MLRFKTIFFILFVLGCNTKKSKKEIIVYEDEPIESSISYASIGKEKLSDYSFFTSPLRDLIPTSNVYPYELNTPLFTDYALKKRFIYLPDGSSANYDEKEVLDFPLGTILIKNFYYDSSQLVNEKSKIIETRLLVLDESGWKALPYIWNEEQTDAILEITGGEQLLTLNDNEQFNYAVPNMAQCKSCHERNGAISPIGPNARQLNKVVNGKNQLQLLEDAGVLNGLPDIKTVKKVAEWDNEKSGTLDERARAYLDINCGHCHRPEGPGKNSGLDLTLFAQSDHALGIFKAPVAAGAGSGGFEYDIVPGNPENSILPYRMESTEPGVMMPELGRKLVHKEGVALIKEWIKSMN